jgi:hypothetical protein
MKRLLLLTVVVLGVSSLAFAQYQPGSIDVYTDAGQVSCNFVDPGGNSLIQVYIFHTHTTGATASQFKLEVPPSAVWSHLGDQWNMPTTIGTSVSGVSLGYGSCQGQLADIHLGTVNFFSFTASAVCDLMSIIPDPASPSGLVEIVDCQTNPNTTKYLLEKGGQGRVNSDGSCDCTVAVHETTWGGIKALYD